MSEKITVSGMVLSAMPIGETDKRVVLLTRELGKISAFARGARRPGNALMAAANPFATGDFIIIPGRNSYVMVGASIKEYFTEMAVQQPGVYYGFYFLDFADFYGREGIDGTDMLNLLYLSLKAILSENLDNRLVRRIYELRLMTMNGDYAVRPEDFSRDALYAAQYIAGAPLTKLFTFTVTDGILKELGRAADRFIGRIMEYPLKSLRILEEMTSS